MKKPPLTPMANTNKQVMNFAALKELVAYGEGPTLEFKKSTGELQREKCLTPGRKRLGFGRRSKRAAGPARPGRWVAPGDPGRSAAK